MRLENMAITLRPRTADEAIDLGYAMTQTWWRTVFAAWCAVYLPAAVVVNLLCWQVPALSVLVLWWLKPAFDRVVLHVLAGATFAATPTLRQTLRALPRLWWKNGLFAALTYARLDFARSFTLPVTQLEGSRGKIGRQRRRILGREGRGAAVWLTIFSANIEITLIASCYFLVNLFSPGEPAFQLSWQMFFNPEVSKGMQLFGNAVNVLAVSILEPFYVAAGFSIYLNCRTAIEGWDVELAFKRLAARLDAERGKAVVGATRLAASLLLGISLVMSVASMPEAMAQTAEQTAAPKTDVGAIAEIPANVYQNEVQTAPLPFTPDTGARKTAAKALSAAEFGHNRDGWAVRYTGPSWGEREPVKPRKWGWLEALVKFFAESMRVLAWIAVALVVAGLLYLLASYVSINGWRRDAKAPPPDMLFGLDVRPGSLPDDLPAAVRTLLARGEMRAAVGLLYRGALVSIIQDGRLEISRSDTEGECLQRVQTVYAANADELAKAQYFEILVRQWQRVAYARVVVDGFEIEPLVDDWERHFMVRSRARAQSTVPSIQPVTL